MSLYPGKLLFFTIISLFFISDARLTLDRSDSIALSSIVKDLGINSQRFPTTNPCSAAGVFCEIRRNDNNANYDLRVTRLVFKSKGLDGFLSPAIGKLSQLKELSVPHNNIADQVPPQIVDCKKLEILDLQNNHFSGEIASNLYSLIRLRVLHLSSNKFTGDLSFFKYFPNLESLSLANNLFSGKIPIEILSFRNLTFLDFSGNNFHIGSTRKVDDQSTVSRYPTRYIFVERSNNINNSTIVAPLPNGNKSTTPKTPVSSPPAHKHKNRKSKVIRWILVGLILGFLVGGAAGTVTFKLVMRVIKGRWRDFELEPSIFSPFFKEPTDISFLEKEDGLASLEIIGRGGCGEVYKAKLPGSGGKMIAIKKVILPSRNAAELTDEGTVGYIAPEYLQTLELTDKCDIYSFGVTLGVLVMGKLPSDDFFQHPDKMSLVKWMRNIWTSDNPSQAIDPKLMGQGYEEQILLVLKTAYLCTLEDPKERPSIKDVKGMLSQRKN
ncbi:hypothetical protein COLO4_05418 [Corchorus olitorius]|uniref:Protein kinase domain-containing protein n=1 Tax=Corchorus olitorius TaxID=93759 RepID=A0A1R3KR06_9ROSI|nr:hypothetical protein COLO4_05418 [Corchorus olitorius]